MLKAGTFDYTTKQQAEEMLLPPVTADAALHKNSPVMYSNSAHKMTRMQSDPYSDHYNNNQEEECDTEQLLQRSVFSGNDENQNNQVGVLSLKSQDEEAEDRDNNKGFYQLLNTNKARRATFQNNLQLMQESQDQRREDDLD